MYFSKLQPIYACLIVLSIIGLFLPAFSFAQEQFGAAMPQTMGEAKNFINAVLDKLPEAVMRVWKEEALPAWKKIWQEINPQIDIWRQKLFQLIGGEIEKNKPAIEEELQKQKKELEKAAKQELLKTGGSFWGGLWEKFKTILELSPAPTPEKDSQSETPYQIPVLVLKYFPTKDGFSLDPGIAGFWNSIAVLRTKTDNLTAQKFNLPGKTTEKLVGIYRKF